MSSRLSASKGDMIMELPKKKGYHRHHIIPKHMGGTDEKDNLIYLTPEEHANAHLELYEKYGKYEDAQAFNTLSSRWLNGRSISGYKQSKEHIEKRIKSMDYSSVSEKLKGRISPTKGLKFGPPSDETRRKISISNSGKKCPEDTKKKISETLKGNIPWNKTEIFCIFCRKRVSISRMDRHSLDRKECITSHEYKKLKANHNEISNKDC